MSCGARMRRRCAGHRAGGGGGGGVGGCAGTGTVGATVWDDYFDCGTLLDTAGARFSGANAWTKYNDGGESYAQTGGLFEPFTNSGPRGALQTLPGGTAWSFRAKLRHVSNSGAFPAAGLLLRESSTDKATGLATVPAGSDTPTEVRVFTAATWGATYTGGTYFGTGGLGTYYWVEIERAGSTINYRTSSDNSTYNLTTSKSLTNDFTTAPNQIGLFWMGFALTVDFETFWRQS